ncbi:MAG TPA: crosslink repair DNA glycosylase YcaQ family protein [Acidimicrobiales bacterium]|nr:crosslink repair DNA glycosylase YcaQ family protein [Acidimicrobiales bacterium]
MAPTGIELSPRDARRIALRAQGLLGPRISGGPWGVVEHLRAVQLDTISVFARTHELVPYSRLGVTPRERIEDAYWSGPPYRAFEYWGHAACVLPITDWPYYGFRRQAFVEKGLRWHKVEDRPRVEREILARLRAEGPLTANQLGGAKKGGPWWDWSDTKATVEWLLDIGEVVCVRRRGFQRVYDLPERTVPPEALMKEVHPDEQVRYLITRAAAAMGVVTAKDLATFAYLKRDTVDRLLPDLDLVQVRVPGWKNQAYATATALATTSSGLRSRPTLISPFDSLIWDRDRTARIFGFHQRLEAYTPKPKRIYGYYSMPVLVGDRLVGRVDPARDNGSFVARSIHIEPSATKADVRGIATAIRTAASWVGATAVRVDVVQPAELRPEIEAALA